MTPRQALALTALLISTACVGAVAQQASNKPFVVKPKPYAAQASSTLSQAGKEAYEKNSCSVCHSINGQGGHEGPMLDGIGARRNSAFLLAHLSSEPGELRTLASLTHTNESDIPYHFRMPNAEAKSVVAYLLTLPQPQHGIVVTGHEPMPINMPTPVSANPPNIQTNTASIIEGKQLFDKFGCAQCHSVHNLGGDLGPALDGISSFRNREYVLSHITNAQATILKESELAKSVPTPMPLFPGTARERDAIADYLMSLPSQSELPH